MLWLEITAPIVGYLGASGYAYRRRYIRLFKDWRRWQAESPDKTHSWVSDYSHFHKKRKEIPFSRYVWHYQDHLPAGVMALVWPAYWPVKGAKALLRPEVKVPDYEKIKELEDIDED